MDEEELEYLSKEDMGAIKGGEGRWVLDNGELIWVEDTRS